MRAARFCPQRLNKVYIIGSTFATHIGGVELLGRSLINVLVFAHGPLTRWTSPAHGIGTILEPVNVSIVVCWGIFLLCRPKRGSSWGLILRSLVFRSFIDWLALEAYCIGTELISTILGNLQLSIISVYFD